MSTISTIILLLSMIWQGTFYPQSFVVREVNYETDEVIVENFTGFRYAFGGCEDWMEGTYAAAIMYDAGTPDDITDDWIIAIRYTGYERR